MHTARLLLSLIFFVGTLVNAARVSDVIESFYKEYPDILDQNALNESGSYQKKARNNANAYMNGKTEDEIRSYYALACIYFATNGEHNPRTINDFAGGKDARVPAWRSSNNWLFERNYCSWYGITCDNGGNVREIDLHNNDLHGSWPNEIVLLRDNLRKIELFQNPYLYSIEPKWLLRMSNLRYLFFGTTAFEANGVSPYLKGCTSLRELDMSNTYWSNGPIRQESFEPLTELYYLDMGDNTYDTTNGNLPEALRESKTLEDLYMDNVIFTPNKFDLGELAEMENLYETWNDFTIFVGGLPSSLGNLRNLRSFSCAYCGLTGTLPAELADTNIDRMWLYGNNFKGRIPEEWANLDDLKYLYLEMNDLTGNVPQALCDLRSNKNNGGELLEFGTDCDSRFDDNTLVSCQSGTEGCCTCCGPLCGHSIEAQPSEPPSGGFCFSGNSLVDVKNRGFVKMTDLALGDVVKVSSDGKYEPIYSFGHKDDNTMVSYLQITTDLDQSLVLSDNHMVVVEGGRKVPSSIIKVGDMLLTDNGKFTPVKDIRKVERRGAYAPFTASGTIAVNGIIASNYIAYQKSENLKIGGIDTSLSFQWLAHTFNSVHRLAMMGWGIAQHESYTDEGISHWVDIPHKLFSWILQKNNFFVAAAFLIPAIAIFGAAAIVENLILNGVSSLFISLGLLLLVARRVVDIKTTKSV